LQGFDTADARQIDVHQNRFRLLLARKLDAKRCVGRAQQAYIGAARSRKMNFSRNRKGWK
jgi:hypothetical protein